MQENFAYQGQNIVLRGEDERCGHLSRFFCGSLLLVVSYQLSALEVILKFEDLEVWKRSSRLCADLYKHFQNIMDMLLLTTDN